MARLERKRAVGILGGTFDPVHLGHLMLAESARVEFRLDHVLFVPAYAPPHKHRPDITAADIRCRMLELAVAGNRAFSVCRLELERKTVAYSVETVRQLTQRYPRVVFYFIVGSDAVPDLGTWKRFDELRAICRFVIACRPQFASEGFPAGALPLRGGMLDISSSEIRENIRNGRAVRYHVPEPVYRFLCRHRLYR
ncbi:MAG: nicotinate-nucleotide adenylyltransferase [Candidatus Omnitrophica bacterium]|nr:nicotinate-nucleotide adenylyltransferase [Candidatus Omnitrophota bacterium]